MENRPQETTNQRQILSKRYFRIGEVGELCDLKPHVLRYWEQEFPQLSPVKRRGNRRYYQREDILMVRQIKHLLYEKDFTIEGAKGQLAKRINGVDPQKEANHRLFIQEAIDHLELLLADLAME